MLNLYTTSHCHLCDEALALLLQICNQSQIVLVEISDAEVLINTYGNRIPVLQRTDTLTTLDWPFDIQKLQQFLSA